MVKIDVVDNREIGISFSGNLFSELLSLMKMRRFQYVPEGQYWTAPAWKINKYLIDITDIDDCSITERADRFLRENIVDKETEFIRTPLNESLLKTPPLEGKPPYEDFQLVDLKKSIQQNRILLAHEMGLGKTWLLVNILNHLIYNKKIDRVLIVVPPEAKYNWRRELIKFSDFFKWEDIHFGDVQHRKPFIDDAKVVIMTYRTFLMISDDFYYLKNPNKKKGSVKKYRKPTIPFDEWGTSRAIILDESHCFPYDIEIETKIGRLKIGEIVEKNLDVRVLSYNHTSNSFEYKRILNVFEHDINLCNVIQLTIQDGTSVISTSNHPFYNGENYIPLEEFNGSQKVFKLRKGISDLSVKKSKVLFSRMLCNLRKQRKQRSYRMSNLWRKIRKGKKLQKEILLNKLFSKMEDESARNSEENLYKDEFQKNKQNKTEKIRKWRIRSYSKTSFSKNEGEQSYDERRSKKKSRRKTKRKNVFVSWRKWKTNRASKNLSKKTSYRTTYGVYNFNKRRKRKISKSTKSLQSRYSPTKHKSSHRNRWTYSQNKKMEILRQKKRRDTSSFRLESNKILELGSLRKFRGSCSENTRVYNIEVEGNNNYFANGFLVHNCIKNRSARQTHVLHLHKKYFDYRYLASGTPDPQGVEGYYSQLNFLDEGIITEDYYEWIGSIANLGNRFSAYAINYYYPDKVEEFTKKIEPWVIRRLQEDCLELPELMIEKIYVGLNPEQQFIYEGVIECVLLKIEKKKEDIRGIVNRFPFMSLALDNPAVLQETDEREYFFGPELTKKIKKWTMNKHSKIEAVDSLVRKHLEQGEKVIVWSGHPVTLNQLAKRYEKKKPFVIHGQVDQESRDGIITDFRESKKRNLMLGSYKVMSTAINLIEANVNIYFDRSYDLKEWLQSMKRTHRFGQSKRVLVYVVITERSLDERLDRKLTRKEDINRNLFNRGMLTIDEWRGIFLGEEV